MRTCYCRQLYCGENITGFNSELATFLCRVDHNIKGQGIYAYVVLAEGTKPSADLKKKLNDVVRNQIGSFAVPDTIHWAPGNCFICSC